MALTVQELSRGIPGLALFGDPATRIEAVTADSRRAGPGVLFVAVRGTGGDGHAFVTAAVAAGCAAVAVASGRETEVADAGREGGPAVLLVARDTRPLPALLARRLHGHPDLSLKTAAVTGTNGKTTVAFLLQGLLNRLHGPCGLLGTIRYEDGRETLPAPLTTPGGPEFYRWLARMRDNGCRSVAMELSSHALDQERTAGLELDVAVMTNLGRDHLDYHRDLADYLAAKARILDLLRTASGTSAPGALVLNAADPLLAGLDTGACRVIRFAARPPAGGGAADLRLLASQLTLSGTRLELDWRGRRVALTSPLVGRFNVENLTAAAAAGLALGLPTDDVLTALAAVPQVPGRFERFLLPSGGLAVVDYAHTPDAITAVLGAADELSAGRLRVVFGCGGDRDRGKRPLMGRAGMTGADEVWITSDNPRSEDPAAICAQVAAGCRDLNEPRAATPRVIIDRAEAVAAALAATGPGEITIIAGKGHEDYQLVGDRRLDLDDRRLVREWIAGEGGDD